MYAIRISNEGSVWVVEGTGINGAPMVRRLPWWLLPTKLKEDILILENGGMLQDGSIKGADGAYYLNTLDENVATALAVKPLHTGRKLASLLARWYRLR